MREQRKRCISGGRSFAIKGLHYWNFMHSTTKWRLLLKIRLWSIGITRANNKVSYRFWRWAYIGQVSKEDLRALVKGSLNILLRLRVAPNDVSTWPWSTGIYGVQKSKYEINIKIIFINVPNPNDYSRTNLTQHQLCRTWGNLWASKTKWINTQSKKKLQ